MEKIKKSLVPDPTDAYILVGDSRVYMAPFGARKEITNSTMVLSFRSLFLRSDEQTQKINELVDEIVALKQIINDRGEK